MSGGFKDSPEVVEFQMLFARLKVWSENDPDNVTKVANVDKEIETLCLNLLKAAGSIQKHERLHRDLFTGPVDPKFILEWRDFEERFAGNLVNIRFDASTNDSGFHFSFDFYEEPEQWVMADYNAMKTAKSLDMTIRFARVRAEQSIAAAGPELVWRPLNPKVFEREMRSAYDQMVHAELKAEESVNEFREMILHDIASSPDEAQKAALREILFRFDSEHDHEDHIDYVAKDGWTFWETLKHESGLDIRGILRRRALVPFVLFPKHVSDRLSSTDLPSLYQNLRQAHEAFIFGVPFAALALMRSVMEMVLLDHYRATGDNLKEYIDSAANRLQGAANAAALHRLRRLVNRTVHGKLEEVVGTTKTEKRDFERQIVSLLFVLRALVENSPVSRTQ